MDREVKKRLDCLTRRVKGLDSNVELIGRMMVISLFLSVIALVMAVLF